jgi:hypothetical protein
MFFAKAQVRQFEVFDVHRVIRRPNVADNRNALTIQMSHRPREVVNCGIDLVHLKVADRFSVNLNRPRTRPVPVMPTAQPHRPQADQHDQSSLFANLSHGRHPDNVIEPPASYTVPMPIATNLQIESVRRGCFFRRRHFHPIAPVAIIPPA